MSAAKQRSRFTLSEHAKIRAAQERVPVEDLLAALAEVENAPRLDRVTGARNYLVTVLGVKYRCVCRGLTVVTLHRQASRRVAKEMQAISRRTRQMHQMDRRRARR